jgi:hypothetical protein
MICAGHQRMGRRWPISLCVGAFVSLDGTRRVDHQMNCGSNTDTDKAIDRRSRSGASAGVNLIEAGAARPWNRFQRTGTEPSTVRHGEGNRDIQFPTNLNHILLRLLAWGDNSLRQ